MRNLYFRRIVCNLPGVKNSYYVFTYNLSVAIAPDMKQFQIFLIGLIIIGKLLINCSYNKKSYLDSDKKQLSFADSLWTEFVQAIENSNIQYLIDNSFDTIICVDCITDSGIKSDSYDSRYIFRNHLKEFMPLDSLSKTEFNTYQDDSLIHISYNIKWKYAEEGAYGLVFIFKKNKNKYLFRERFFVP